MDKYLNDHEEIAFVVYKDYDCETYRASVEVRLSFEAFYFSPLETDQYIPECVSEEIYINSEDMKEAMTSIKSFLPEIVSQEWWSSNTMKGPYLPLYHYRSVIEEKMVTELSAEHQNYAKLLLEFTHEYLGSKYDQADALFSKGAVSKEHFSKLFRVNDVVVTFENDQPLAYFCNDLPKLDLPSFEKQKSSSVAIFYRGRDWGFKKGSSTLTVQGSAWHFDGKFRLKPRTFSLDWPSSSPVMRVCDLKAYPLRYDKTGLREKLEIRGRKFWMCRRRNYICYDVPDPQIESQNVSSH
jgi:hypothetical protein